MTKPMICTKRRCPIHNHSSKGYQNYCIHSKPHNHQMHCDSEYAGCSSCSPYTKKKKEKEKVSEEDRFTGTAVEAIFIICITAFMICMIVRG